METIGKQRGTSDERGLVEKDPPDLPSFSTRPRSALVTRCFPIVSTDREPGTGMLVIVATRPLACTDLIGICFSMKIVVIQKKLLDNISNKRRQTDIFYNHPFIPLHLKISYAEGRTGDRYSRDA